MRDNPSQDLSGLDRNLTLDNQALAPIFDAQKVQEKLEMGQVAGQVGMTAAGDLASYMANHATTLEQQASWSDGGTNKVLLHGLVGAATAALGGGDALQGALGAAASEAASKAMSDYLASQHIDPYSKEGRLLMSLASTAIGGLVGGESGAATALQGDLYNRSLHPEYVHRINQAAQQFADEQCAAGTCISADEARNRLIYEAYRLQDAAFDQTQVAQGKPEDPAALAFLGGKASGYIDLQTGQSIDLSSATPKEYHNSSLFANALYNDSNAYEWVRQATGLSDNYLQNLARQDYYGNQLPAYADRYADWTANQTLRDIVGYGTPFGGAATAGELAYRGQYGEAVKEVGKDLAVNIAAAGVGKAVGATASVIKAAIKDGATGEVAGLVGESLKAAENEGSQAVRMAEEAKVGSNFSTTKAVRISGERAIDQGQSYEKAVADLYGSQPREVREFMVTIDGNNVRGVADNVTIIGGKETAVEAKFVEDWGDSLRNPSSAMGDAPWALAEQQKMVEQAKKYTSAFDGGVIYHTNSSELAAYYTKVFEDAGISNFRFIITPAIR